jgi:hypothetical protein
MFNNHNNIIQGYKTLCEEISDYKESENVEKDIKYMKELEEIIVPLSINFSSFDEISEGVVHTQNYEIKEINDVFSGIDSINKTLNQYIKDKNTVIVCLSNRYKMINLEEGLNNKNVVIHKHSYNWVSLNGTLHQYKCDCGSVIDTAEHTAEADDNDCTTATKCTVCGHILVEANDFHTPDADGKCMDCDVTLEADTTKPVETTTPTTDKPEESGCKGSVSIAGLALVATLGTCAVFVEKKRK